MFHPEFLDVIEHVSEWINIVFFLPALFIAFVPPGADGLSKCTEQHLIISLSGFNYNAK